jgi:hypothetical protein
MLTWIQSPYSKSTVDGLVYDFADGMLGFINARYLYVSLDIYSEMIREIASAYPSAPGIAPDYKSMRYSSAFGTLEVIALNTDVTNFIAVDDKRWEENELLNHTVAGKIVENAIFGEAA